MQQKAIHDLYFETKDRSIATKRFFIFFNESNQMATYVPVCYLKVLFYFILPNVPGCHRPPAIIWTLPLRLRIDRFSILDRTKIITWKIYRTYLSVDIRFHMLPRSHKCTLKSTWDYNAKSYIWLMCFIHFLGTMTKYPKSRNFIQWWQPSMQIYRQCAKAGFSFY